MPGAQNARDSPLLGATDSHQQTPKIHTRVRSNFRWRASAYGDNRNKFTSIGLSGTGTSRGQVVDGRSGVTTRGTPVHPDWHSARHTRTDSEAVSRLYTTGHSIKVDNARTGARQGSSSPHRLMPSVAKCIQQGPRGPKSASAECREIPATVAVPRLSPYNHAFATLPHDRRIGV